MNRFLLTSLAISLSILSVFSFASSSVSAASPYDNIYKEVSSATVERKGFGSTCESTDISASYTSYLTNESNWATTSYDFQSAKESFQRALNTGRWGVSQQRYASGSDFEDSVFLFWTEDTSLELEWRLSPGEIMAQSKNNQSSLHAVQIFNSPDCSVKLQYYNASQVNLRVSSENYPNPDGASSAVLFVYTDHPNYPEGYEGEMVKDFIKVGKELIRPEITVSVTDKMVQTTPVREYEFLPGYPDRDYRIDVAIRTCGDKVTADNFNPGDVNLEKVFGFFKFVTDPMVNMYNGVAQAVRPGSIAAVELSEMDRARLLWCTNSEIIRLSQLKPGVPFNIAVDAYDYYVVTASYSLVNCVGYGENSVSGEYCYTQVLLDTDDYDYEDREIVFDIDGSTYSLDTRDLDCEEDGLPCEAPPNNLDCSYEAQGTWSKVIACHVSSFFTTLGNFFKWLFIPDPTRFSYEFNKILETLKTSLGFVGAPFVLIGSVYQGMIDTSVVGDTCALPPMTFFGSTATVELCKWRYQFPQLWSLMQIAIQGSLAFMFLWTCYRLFMKIFGAEVQDHEEDQSETHEVRWHDERTGEKGEWMRRRK